MKACEIIPILMIVSYKFITDPILKAKIDKLILKLVPEATEEFFEHFGLLDVDDLKNS